MGNASTPLFNPLKYIFQKNFTSDQFSRTFCLFVITNTKLHMCTGNVLSLSEINNQKMPQIR